MILYPLIIPNVYFLQWFKDIHTWDTYVSLNCFLVSIMGVTAMILAYFFVCISFYHSKYSLNFFFSQIIMHILSFKSINEDKFFFFYWKRIFRIYYVSLFFSEIASVYFIKIEMLNASELGKEKVIAVCVFTVLIWWNSLIYSIQNYFPDCLLFRTQCMKSLNYVKI